MHPAIIKLKTKYFLSVFFTDRQLQLFLICLFEINSFKLADMDEQSVEVRSPHIRPHIWRS